MDYTFSFLVPEICPLTTLISPVSPRRFVGTRECFMMENAASVSSRRDSYERGTPPQVLCVRAPRSRMGSPDQCALVSPLLVK